MQHTETKAPVRKRKMLLAAVALASGVTLECDEAAGIGLFDSGLGCQPTAGFASSCRIVGVTTNCGVPISCDEPETGTYTTCTFATPASDCEITVSFADGTQRTVPVSVFSHGADCGSASVYGIALPLQCNGADAGVDASDATTDVSEDTSSDAPADATSE